MWVVLGVRGVARLHLLLVQLVGDIGGEPLAPLVVLQAGSPGGPPTHVVGLGQPQVDRVFGLGRAQHHDLTTRVQNVGKLGQLLQELVPVLDRLRIVGSLYVIANDQVHVGTGDHRRDPIGRHRWILRHRGPSPNVKAVGTVPVVLVGQEPVTALHLRRSSCRVRRVNSRARVWVAEMQSTVVSGLQYSLHAV